MIFNIVASGVFLFWLGYLLFALGFMAFAILFASTLLLSAVMEADVMDIFYETVSAAATVGLSRNLTPSLNAAGKLIIIGTMYLGRVGPISLAIALNSHKIQMNVVKNPTEEISCISPSPSAPIRWVRKA